MTTSRRTLSDALSLTLSVRWHHHKDQERSYTRAKACVEYLGEGRAVDSVTPSDLRRLADHLESGGRSPATVNRYVAALTAVLRTAHEEGWRPVPPPPFRKGKERRRERAPTRGEVAAMLRALRAGSSSTGRALGCGPGDGGSSPPTLTTSRGRLVARAARLLYRTGMRLGEVLDMDARAVSWGGGDVTLWDTKNGDTRVVPVPPSCRSWLARHASFGRSPFPIPPSTFSAAWRRAREAAGIGEWFTPHTLRHARASALLSGGVPIPVVAQILGHRSWRTTQRYCHVGSDAAREAMEQVR